MRGLGEGDAIHVTMPHTEYEAAPISVVVTPSVSGKVIMRSWGL
jgi:hypothetical protein